MRDYDSSDIGLIISKKGLDIALLDIAYPRGFCKTCINLNESIDIKYVFVNPLLRT